eukprot:CAMPEP_0170244006 /NCGR_PEP_ID=MMETSP0116_2-20130129/21781_1 /TAXON_ID=400756 /ORGANISM="Durinskia baltica, Strain CSIRO CS-38" /LENGTH=71 /DNA_ID=CAMNT_0010494865 /DNA_START=74 /DNA_END=286 /DNA_ORIENTATION=+
MRTGSANTTASKDFRTHGNAISGTANKMATKWSTTDKAIKIPWPIVTFVTGRAFKPNNRAARVDISLLSGL